MIIVRRIKEHDKDQHHQDLNANAHHGHGGVGRTPFALDAAKAHVFGFFLVVVTVEFIFENVVGISVMMIRGPPLPFGQPRHGHGIVKGIQMGRQRFVSPIDVLDGNGLLETGYSSFSRAIVVSLRALRRVRRFLNLVHHPGIHFGRLVRGNGSILHQLQGRAVFFQAHRFLVCHRALRAATTSSSILRRLWCFRIRSLSCRFGGSTASLRRRTGRRALRAQFVVAGIVAGVGFFSNRLHLGLG